MRRARGAAAVALVAGLVALSGSVESAAQTPTPAKARWTFLYYLAADNQLEPFLLSVLEEVADAGAKGDVKVVALIDRSAKNTGQGDGNLGSIPPFTDAKLLEVAGGDFKVLEEPGEVDMGRAETLVWFLARGMTLFPAERYVVVVPGAATGVIGVAFDQGANPSALSMTEVADGMQAALKAMNEPTFDLVGFNASHTAQFDLAAKLAPSADYMLASEDKVLVDQWDETALIQAAMKQPRATGLDLARAVLTRMDVLLAKEQQWTMSIIDLKQIGNVTRALDSFGQAVVDTVAATKGPLTRAQAASLHFGGSPASDDISLYDIGDLVAHLDGVPPQVETAANALWEASRRAVVQSGKGSASAAASGMALYFPRRADEYSAVYAQEAVSRTWVEALNVVTGGAEVTPGSAVPELSSFTLDIRPDGVVATANVKPVPTVELVSATQYDGLLQPDGSVYYLAVTPASLVFTEPVVVSGQWNFQYAQLTDGVTALPSTIFLYPTSGALYASVPLLYQAVSGAQAQATLSFTIDGSGAIGGPPTVYLESGAALNAEPGARLTPLILVVKPGGAPSFQRISDLSLDATVPVGVAGTRVPAGATFVVALNVVDVKNGNGADSATGAVP